MKLLVLAIVVAAASALSDCDPIDPARCALPFPNNFWLRPNATTGKLQLQFSKVTFPRDVRNRTTDAAVGGWNDADGFSASMPITSFWTNLSLDTSKVPRYWAMDGSTQKDSPTILLDTQTGMLVPHFCELDFWAGNGQGQQMFITWPAFRLADSRRYIVAMRNLVKTDGTAQQPSVAFKALRDNIPTTNPDVEERRGLFKDIFARLSALGVDQSSLLIAWDFTTASRDALTGRMIAMRDDAFARVAPEDIKYSIKTVTDNVSADIIREIKGSFWVPSYVNSPYPGSRLVLDANGRPVYQRMDEATFTVRVPYSLVGNGTTGIILQYGHGLFGSQEEVHAGYLGQEANQHGYVLAAADWIGLSQYDEPSVAIMMATDLTNFNILPDRCQQGMLNALFLMRLLGNGVFSRDPSMVWNGKPVLDKSSPKHYFGNSQGGILGTMYMAVTTDVIRGCVGVPGGPYSLMLPRSKDFAPLATILKARYVDPLDRFIWFGVFQLLWDRADPGAYMGAITSNPLPNTPAHEILIHHALGDQQVSYLGAYNIGRSVGAVMFESNVHEPNETLYGFPFISDTAVAHTAAIVTWVFPDVPPVPQIDIPPPGDKDTHEGPRREKTAQDQMYHFFTTGEIINTCGGPCQGSPQRTTREVDPWAKLENPAKLLASE